MPYAPAAASAVPFTALLGGCALPHAAILLPILRIAFGILPILPAIKSRLPLGPHCGANSPDYGREEHKAEQRLQNIEREENLLDFIAMLICQLLNPLSILEI